MLEWSVIFNILALIIAAIALTGISILPVATAKMLFFVFLVLSIFSFVSAALLKRKNNNLVIDIK